MITFTKSEIAKKLNKDRRSIDTMISKGDIVEYQIQLRKGSNSKSRKVFIHIPSMIKLILSKRDVQ